MDKNDMNTQERLKSEQILDDMRQKIREDQIVDVEEERVQIIVFRLSGDLFGIYGSSAKEVLEVDKVTAVPGSSPCIVGIVNVRGDVESVIDLNLFLQLPPEPNSSRIRIVIAQSGNVRSGLRVAEIEDVVEIPQSTVHAALPTLGENIRPFVVGETRLNGKNVTLLDIDRIFEKIVAE